jgi:hypothetical protein
MEETKARDFTKLYQCLGLLMILDAKLGVPIPEAANFRFIADRAAAHRAKHAKP